MYMNIFVDGDNIPLQKYVDVHDTIAGNTETTPVVYCQSNIVFKYKSNAEINVVFKCCKTKNKNATDARILLDTGKALQRGEKVVIVSNDKIFKEVECDDVELYNCTFKKQNKLKKNTIIRLVKQWREENEDHEDMYISDLLEHFPNYKMERIRNYIQSIPELELNQNDGVYFR